MFARIFEFIEDHISFYRIALVLTICWFVYIYFAYGFDNLLELLFIFFIGFILARIL